MQSLPLPEQKKVHERASIAALKAGNVEAHFDHAMAAMVAQQNHFLNTVKGGR